VNASAWSEVVAALDSRDAEAAVTAAERLHAEADAADVSNLLALLESSNFFVREAAAWPLAELAGPFVLRELFEAYQLGFDEGHDNDGFAAALLEIPALFPVEAKLSLERIISAASEPLSGHARWLLEFCEDA
jgi:hypothetical protein